MRTTQKRNRFGFLVTWPEQVSESCPADLRDIAERNAGKSYRTHYPTLEAMDTAAEGFRMAGAAVTA